MALKLPHDKYLRFLSLAQPKTKDVQKTLKELNLPEATDREIEAHGTFLETVLPESIFEQAEKKKFSPGFTQWMASLEIEELWHLEKKYPNRDPRKAATAEFVMGLHGDPILTLTLNALLIKSLPGDNICQMLNSKFSCMIEPHHVALYQKFFFNPAHMTRSSWRWYLERCNSRQKSVYFIALSESLDELKTELGLPSKTQSSGVLQFLLSKSFQKAKMYLELSTAEANKEARAWIDSVLSLTDKYEKYRTGDTEDFANQLELAFEFDEGAFAVPDHQTLSELTETLVKRSEGDDKKSNDAQAKKESSEHTEEAVLPFEPQTGY